MRLYGTGLPVLSPDVLRDGPEPLVVLRTGVYDAEIRTSLSQRSNGRVRFC